MTPPCVFDGELTDSRTVSDGEELIYSRITLGNTVLYTQNSPSRNIIYAFMNTLSVLII